MKTQKIISFRKTNTLLTPALVIGFLLFLNSFSGSYVKYVEKNNIDFFTWWAVPHGLSRHYIQVPYSEEDGKKLADKIKNERATSKTPNVESDAFQQVLDLYNGRIIATATPFFYAVFNRFVTEDYQKDKERFILVYSICFVLAIFILGRMLEYSYLTLFIFYFLLTRWFWPYHIDSLVGNVNQIQLLLTAIGIFFYVKAKNSYHFIGVGLCLGLSLLFKINMSFVFLFALLTTVFNQEFKKTLALILGFILSVFLAFFETAVYFQASPIFVWKSWLQTSSTIHPGSYSIVWGNNSLSKLIHIYSGLNVSVYLYAGLIFLFIWILFAARSSSVNPSLKIPQVTKEDRALTEAFRIAGFGSITILLASGLSWCHYYISIIPIFFFFLRPQTEAGFPSKMHFLTIPLTCVALSMFTPLVLRIVHGPEAFALDFNIAVIILLVIFILNRK